MEVLVALVVAVAAMTLLAQGFMTGARSSTSSQAATRAALVAQRALTEFETGQLSLSSGQNGTFPDEPDFAFETNSDTGEVTGLTKLTITVKWKESNQDRKYVLTRLLKDRPVESSTVTPAPTTTPPK